MAEASSRGSGAEGLDLHLSVDKTAGFVGASAGQQGDEDLGVGGSPAGDRVPAGSGLVAGDRDRWRGGGEDHSVVAGGDVVERLVVQRAAGDRGCDGWHRVQPRWQPIIGGRADQPAETGTVLIVASASTIELCEQSFTDTLVCGLPGPSCLIAATACADSVPSGPAWPTEKMVAPACSWPGLAWGMTTSVSPEVVTRTRPPPDVTRVKPAVLASATVPWTAAKPAGLTALNGCPRG